MRSSAPIGIALSVLLLPSCAGTDSPGRPPDPSCDAACYDRAIRLGSDWFLNNQSEDFLHYEFYVDENRHGDDRLPLREVATLWSVAKAANYLDDPQLHELARRGLAYFESRFERDGQDGFMYLNIDAANLGYSAFVILALLEMEHSRREEYLELFANGILHLQEPTGRYRTYFFEDRDTDQDFFPGEACLALMSLYDETRDARLLESVKLAFPYYAPYWRGNRTTSFIPWQTQALQRLYEVTGDDAVRDFVFEISDYMIEYHHTDEPCAGFELKGIIAGIRVEGMIRAYELAREVGDAKRLECYGNFVREGGDYLVDLQYTNIEKHPKPAIGGFPGRKEPKMRVDRNQHAVVALIEGRELGILK